MFHDASEQSESLHCFASASISRGNSNSLVAAMIFRVFVVLDSIGNDGFDVFANLPGDEVFFVIDILQSSIQVVHM
jgi:hypothetical protein